MQYYYSHKPLTLLKPHICWCRLAFQSILMTEQMNRNLEMHALEEMKRCNNLHCMSFFMSMIILSGFQGFSSFSLPITSSNGL